MPTYDFSDEYKTYVFTTWYGAGKPEPVQLIEMLEPSVDGKKPSLSLLKIWQRDFTQIALTTDEQAMEKLHNNLAEKKAAILARHAETGYKLQEMGIQYLEEHGITRARDAIDAIKLGVSIERDAMFGQNIVNLEKLSKLTDDDLLNLLRDMADNKTLDVPFRDEDDNAISE